jgi:hypothetical protein
MNLCFFSFSCGLLSIAGIMNHSHENTEHAEYRVWLGGIGTYSLPFFNFVNNSERKIVDKYLVGNCSSAPD